MGMKLSEVFSDKRHILIASAILVLIVAAVVIILLVIGRKEPPRDPNFDYSADPEKWIRPGNETMVVDVPQATAGRGQHIYSQERYIEANGNIVALYLEGNYEGAPFKRAYNDINNTPKMRIFPEMNPGDGIKDAFALFKQEDGEWAFYLYVDQDWKDQSGGDINVIWGSNIRNTSSLHTVPFDFSHEKDGIYYMKINEDIDWFQTQNPITGRLIFGEVTLSQIREKDYRKTFVLVY